MLIGLALMVVAGPGLFLVAMISNTIWAWALSLGCVALGLMLIVQALIPNRNLHGTKPWQNDGVPGGL